jgi:hypothetical protein
MLIFRLKQKKIEEFFNQNINSLGFSRRLFRLYLKEWKRKNLSEIKDLEN